MNKRLQEIMTRLASISTEMDADGADIEALTNEVNTLTNEKRTIEADIQKRQALRSQIAAGSVPGVVIEAAPAAPAVTEAEKRAKAFAATNHMIVGNEEVRSVLVSSGQIATPTEVSGINDIVGPRVSSIVDLVKVVNCTGMGKNRVSVITADADEADDQTEGEEATSKDPNYGYRDITPTSVAVVAEISKQVKKQSPLLYETKTKEQAFLSLRKKTSKIIANTLIAEAAAENTLIEKVAAKITSGKVVIDENTLSDLYMAYGGDEGVVGAAYLVLNKADLQAFGKVRGSQDKKKVYEITPDAANPNMGTIKDGGTVVNYILNKNIKAANGTTQPAKGSADIATMFYGQLKNFELDLFSDYEINVSTDYNITKLMDTIVGDVELGAAVVAKGGFVTLNIAAATA